MNISIYKQDGSLYLETLLTDRAERKRSVTLGDNSAKLSFDLDKYYVIPANSYINYDSEKFYLLADYRPSEKEGTFSYAPSFFTKEALLKKYPFYYQIEGQPKIYDFRLSVNLPDVARLVIKALDYYLPDMTWLLGELKADTPLKDLSFSGVSVLEAAQYIASQYETECWFDGDSLNFARCEKGEIIDLPAQTKLKSYNQADKDDAPPSKIKSFGGTKNMPTTTSSGANYGNRLQLPDGIDFVEIEGVDTGAIEIKFFDDIYPKTEGTITDVVYNGDEKNPIYYVKDLNRGFDLSTVTLPGLTPRIVFLSGRLTGRGFNIQDTTSSFGGVPLGYMEVFRETQEQWFLPRPSLEPRVGDRYLIENIALPEAKVEQERQVLLQETIKYAKERALNLAPIKCENNPITNPVKIELGQRFRLAIHPQDRAIEGRVTELSYAMTSPHESGFTLTQNTTLGRLQQIERNITTITESLEAPYAEYHPLRGSAQLPLAASQVTAKDVTASDITGDMARIDKGITVGDFKAGTLGSGGAVTINTNGDSEAEFDFLKVRKKATFTEIVVQELKNIGGELVVSPAGMICSRVESVTGGYKCFFEKTDSDGKSVYQQFEVGDQARCQTFNLVKNKYYWRLVTQIGSDYIVLSDTDKDGYDIPEAGDNITQLGNRTKKERQNAQVISAYGSDAPSFKQYAGINSYSLVGKQKTVLSPTGNEIDGKVTIKAGSTGANNLTDLPDEVIKAIEASDIEYGKNNMLRNSGFTGDYLPIDVSPTSTVTATSEVFSPSLEYWTNANANVAVSTVSQSGYEVKLSIGSLSQNLAFGVMLGEKYIVSFKGKNGLVQVSVGGTTKVISLGSDYERHVIKLEAKADGNKFTITGSGTICELQLERGTIPSSWGLSILDNTEQLAKYQNLQYLVSAIKEGKTSILGGLVLAAQLQLGNFANGEMTEVTSGISGIYNNENDVSYWAGGTFEEAIKAVYTYFDRPEYSPTEDELANMANAVITHGGRAILNDVILRGYIYALGGRFKGHVEAESGSFRGHVEAESGSFKGDVKADTGRFGMLEVVGNDLIGYKKLEDGTETQVARISVNAIPDTSESYVYDPIVDPIPVLKGFPGVFIQPMIPTPYAFGWNVDMEGIASGNIAVVFQGRRSERIRIGFGDLQRNTGVNLSYSVNSVRFDSSGNIIKLSEYKSGTLSGRDTVLVEGGFGFTGVYVYFQNVQSVRAFATIEFDIEIGTRMLGTILGSNGILCSHPLGYMRFTNEQGFEVKWLSWGLRVSGMGIQWSKNGGTTWSNDFSQLK